MRWLWLHDNPGAPFPLTVNLVERDVPPARAPYIARVAAEVAAGTPFDVTVALSVGGGVEDPPTLSIARGSASSHETAVITRVGAVPVRVGIVAPPPLPTHRCGGQPCFKGLVTSVGKPLRLFDAEPTVTEQIANQEIGPDGDAVTLHLGRYFSDPDRISLVYAATSSDPAVATVTVTGETAKITSAGELDGSATITLRATDSDGASATMEFTVAIRAEITRNRWRAWRLAAILAARKATTERAQQSRSDATPVANP